MVVYIQENLKQSEIAEAKEEGKEEEKGGEGRRGLGGRKLSDDQK